MILENIHQEFQLYEYNELHNLNYEPSAPSVGSFDGLMILTGQADINGSIDKKLKLDDDASAIGLMKSPYVYFNLHKQKTSLIFKI